MKKFLLITLVIIFSGCDDSYDRAMESLEKKHNVVRDNNAMFFKKEKYLFCSRGGYKTPLVTTYVTSDKWHIKSKSNKLINKEDGSYFDLYECTNN